MNGESVKYSLQFCYDFNDNFYYKLFVFIFLFKVVYFYNNQHKLCGAFKCDKLRTLKLSC